MALKGYHSGRIRPNVELTVKFIKDFEGELYDVDGQIISKQFFSKGQKELFVVGESVLHSGFRLSLVASHPKDEYKLTRMYTGEYLNSVPFDVFEIVQPFNKFPTLDNFEMGGFGFAPSGSYITGWRPLQ